MRITFDDGNASDVEHALPALRRRGLTGTFFVVAGRLGEPGFLDADGVRALAAAGMTVGSHGMRHRPWRELDDRRCTRSSSTPSGSSRTWSERPVTEAACPFGSYDRRVLGALRRSAYRHVYTSDRGRGPARRLAAGAQHLRRRDGAEHLARIGERSMPIAR